MCEAQGSRAGNLVALTRSRGPGKRAKETGLNSRSRPKFKRNSRKLKTQLRGRRGAKEKSDAGGKVPVSKEEDRGAQGDAIVDRASLKRQREGPGDKKFVKGPCVCV